MNLSFPFLKCVRKYNIKNNYIYFIMSSPYWLILYGSIIKGETHAKSDCDIAIITKDAKSKKAVEDVFIEKISTEFYEYFGISLDAYVKTEKEFISRLKKKTPPVSTLMKAYTIIYGKDPNKL